MAQMNYPWLEPTTYEDQHGLVSNVTFVEGLLVFFKDTWFAYYRQSDSTLGVATYKVGDTYSDLGRPALQGARSDDRLGRRSGAHHRWLEAEGDRLLEFSRASRHPASGFAWLGVDGPTTSTARSSCGSPAG